MATVTSYTEEKILDLMSGWEGVSDEQAAINAYIASVLVQLNTNSAALEEFENVTLPGIQEDVTNASIAVSTLTDTSIPNLQAQITTNTEDLQALNDVTLVELAGALDSNSNWIIEFNEVTVPDLITRLEAAEAAVATIDLTDLNTAVAALQDKFPITGPDIAANAIEANHILADTITALQIAADTITANEIAADTITANEIAAGAVTAAEILAGTITALQIAADTITANEIAADTITANEIAADTITANEIAADTITANEIAADTITANEIAADTITANEIAAATITGDEVAAHSLTTSHLIISDLTNLVVDGDMRDTTSANWFQMVSDGGVITRYKDSGEPAYLESTNGFVATHIFIRNENQFQVANGDEFHISLEVSTPATNTETLEFTNCLAVFDQNGDSQLWRGVNEGPVPLPPDTPWTAIEGSFKITESGLAFAQWNPWCDDIVGALGTQKLRIRKVNLRRRGTGKLIVDGSIQGKQLAVNTITANEIDTATLTGDLFVGEVIFAGLMRAGDLDDNGLIISGYSEMGARGIYTVDSDGVPVFSAPTTASDGAYLKAHLDLLSADVRDNFTMHGTNNSIAVESELTLSAGVEAPSVPPVLTQVWDTVQFNKTTAVPPHTPNAGYNMGTFAFNPAQAVSMCWDAAWSCWVVIQQKSNGFRVWRFTTSGAIYNNLATGRPWVDDYNDRFNAAVTEVNDQNGIATIFKSGDDWYVWAPNNINRIPASWIIDAASRPPALYYDTINNQYCLVQNNGGGNGTIHVRRFTITGGGSFPNATNVSTNNFEAGSGLSQRINGAVYGSQLGVTGWAINTDEYQTVYTFNGSGTAYDDDGSYRNWLKPGAALGFAHNGSQFASIDSAGVLTLYENWTWLASDRYVWVGASAYDSDTAGNTANPHVGQTAGQHETPVGTLKAIQLNRRSKLRITMSETNDSGGADDPDKWKLYFKRGLSVAPTDASLLKYIDMIGSPTASTSVTISADPTGGAPPGGIKGQPGAINNFPGADPGRIESAKTDGSGAILQMLGDGTGRWGTLSVDANGKAVIGGDTGWINATLTGGWSNYGSPYSGAQYRRIGNVVYLRGLVKDGAFGASNPIFTLPAGFRPAGGVAGNDLILTGTTQSRAQTVSGDGTKTSSSPDDNTTASANSHTHGMSQHKHTVTYNLTSSFTNSGSRVDVRSDGIVHCASDGGSWCSLSGISFLVD
jgi:hypothetical protein